MNREQFAVLIVCCAACIPTVAIAEEETSDPERMARARELFIEGVDLADQEHWSEARERFEEALTHHDAPTIRFNLGATYAQLDMTLEAAEQLDSVLADPNTPDDLATQARQLLTGLEERIASIDLSSDALEPNAEILLDGQPLTSAQRSNPFRVLPGDHQLTATLDGQEIASEVVTVSPGQTLEVELSPPRPVEESIVEAAEEEEEERPLIRDWRLWVGIGAGVVVLTTAIAVGVTVGGQDRVEDPVQGNMAPSVLYWR